MREAARICNSFWCGRALGATLNSSRTCYLSQPNQSRTPTNMHQSAARRSVKMCCLEFGTLKMLNGVTMKRMIPMMPLTLMCLPNSTLRLRFSWIWRVTSEDDARSGEESECVLARRIGGANSCARIDPGRCARCRKRHREKRGWTR
jgi:hypothetical protein